MTGDTLASLICDAMLCLGLPVKNLRGQCYDDAANMSGRFQGVQVKIGQKQPLALYIHCSNHCLNLALQDCGKKVPLVRNTLQFVNEVGVLIRNSAKRLGQFRHFAPLLDVVCSALCPLCPTRWTVRVKAITDVIDSYPVLLRTLEEIASSTADAVVSVRGFLMNFEKREVVIGLLICFEVFAPTEQLSITLQRNYNSAAGVQDAVGVVLSMLRSITITNYGAKCRHL